MDARPKNRLNWKFRNQADPRPSHWLQGSDNNILLTTKLSKHISTQFWIIKYFHYKRTQPFLEFKFGHKLGEIIYKIGFWNVWFALILTYRFEMFLNSSLGQRLDWLFFGWFEISATHERKSCRPRSAGLDKCVLEFLDILRFQLIFW